VGGGESMDKTKPRACASWRLGRLGRDTWIFFLGPNVRCWTYYFDGFYNCMRVIGSPRARFSGVPAGDNLCPYLYPRAKTTAHTLARQVGYTWISAFAGRIAIPMLTTLAMKTTLASLV
jgi:hypothetical protein